MEVAEIKGKQRVGDLPPGQVVKLNCGGWWMLTDEILGDPDEDGQHISIKAINLTGGNTMWLVDDCLVTPVLCRLEILSEVDDE